jgi:hypothetical protein
MRHLVFYREALREGFERTDDKPGYIDRIVEATQAFGMPHTIYQLHVDFFDNGDWPISEEILPQLVRSFSFDGDCSAASPPHARRNPRLRFTSSCRWRRRSA